MKRVTLVGQIILVSLLCLCTTIAYAQPAKIPQESGLSGFVNPGVAFWRVEDNMVKKISYFKVLPVFAKVTGRMG